ncbi:MAG TPA: ATP-binding cassette domain-containing protein, partial [Thermomicrobiales bacterium]|nr:ATP-binding cassette domain-containing protein [Thermomicrobiales bacterium]
MQQVETQQTATIDAVTPGETPLIDVKNLEVQFPLDQGTVYAVNDVSFSIAPGKTLGVVGESGCGKSVTARSILRILREPGKIVG